MNKILSGLRAWASGLLGFWGMVLLFAQLAAAQQPKPGPTDLSLNDPQTTRWVMLHNGAVFSGIVSQDKQRVAVQVDTRTKMQFDNLQVAVIADQPSDLFEYRRTRLSAADLPGRLELIRWCLTNSLLTEAAAEFEVLQARGIPASQLRSVELAIQAERQRRQPAAPTPPAALASQTVRTDGKDRADRADRTENRDQTEQSDRTVAAVPADAPVINSVFSFFDQPGFKNSTEIQAVIDNRPPQDSVQLFNDRVHWTLVQACAGCHYPENQRLVQLSGLSLEIPSAQHKTSLQQLRHNYDQFIQLISRENPGNSRLVGLLTEVHGPLREPPVAVRSEDFEAIMNWIYKSGAKFAVAEDSSRVVTASAEVDPQKLDSRQQALSATRVDGLIPGLLSGPTSWQPQVDPRTPYDPAAFNKHYHPTGKPQLPTATEQPKSLDPQTNSLGPHPNSLGPPGLPRIKLGSPNSATGTNPRTNSQSSSDN